MNIKTAKNKGIVEIAINDLGDAKARVMQSLGQCQSGNCNCKTQEYQKLEKMEIKEADNNLTIKLHPKDGENLDVNEINKCVDTLR